MRSANHNPKLKIKFMREKSLKDTPIEPGNMIITMDSENVYFDILSANSEAKRINVSDFYSTEQVNNLLESYYTKSQIDGILTGGESLSSIANTNLSNLTPEGEKHFLNKTQITNCITEIPQRIKYTLEDGTLTIKAGSVVIVPYGIEDLTETYPIGSVFLNENYKVVDTQFKDDKFFLWVELVNDFIKQPETITNSAERLGVFGLSTHVLSFYATTISSDSTPSQQNCNVYRTDLNLVQAIRGGVVQDYVYSLPILTAKSDGNNIAASITQVWNGFGYIGNVAWLDKGVKGLFADGRNEDGTYKSKTFETDALLTVSGWENDQGYLYLNKCDGGFNLFTGLKNYNQDTTPDIITHYQRWYNSALNYWFYHEDNVNYWTKHDGGPSVGYVLPVVDIATTNSTITNFKSHQPFQVANVKDLDGIFVSSEQTIVSDVAMSTSVVTYSLADYLPNDGNIYEVWLDGYIKTGTTSGNYGNLYIGSDLTNGTMGVCGTHTRTNSSMSSYGMIVVPVGRKRYIKVGANDTPKATYRIRVFGYRKIRG